MNKHEFQRGQTLPFIAVTVLLLVGVAGFAADVGYHQYQQRMQQTAADSAALAAAAELMVNGDYNTAGQRDAASNGFTDGVGSVHVTIVSPAASPDPYSTNSSAVEADIKNTYPTFFERVFNIQTVDVTTKAVAIANAPSKWCIVALDTSGTTNIDAHSTVDAPNCDMAINSKNFSVGGQSTLYTADPIQYAGSLSGAGTSTFSPGAPVQALPATDPCDQIASCLYLKQNPPATTPCTTFDQSNIQSGQIYCDMNFKSDATLPAGFYVVTGKFNAGNVTLSGTGVTIVDTATNNININNATLNLSAPTSGNYAGMLFYAPNFTQPITMNSGNGGFSGIVYTPKANLTMNAGTTLQAIIITGQLSLNSSNTTFEPPPGIKITYPRLVE